MLLSTLHKKIYFGLQLADVACERGKPRLATSVSKLAHSQMVPCYALLPRIILADIFVTKLLGAMRCDSFISLFMKPEIT